MSPPIAPITGTGLAPTLTESHNDSVVRAPLPEAPPLSGKTVSHEYTHTSGRSGSRNVTITLTDVPASWTPEETAEFFGRVERMNRYIEPPITSIVIGSRSSYNSHSHTIQLAARDVEHFATVLPILTHELGHAALRHPGVEARFFADPQASALRGLMRFGQFRPDGSSAAINTAAEIIDDSNYVAQLPDAYGHPLDEADGESFDGSGVAAYFDAQRLAELLQAADAPDFARAYGTAVYSYLHDNVFRGEHMHRAGADILRGAPVLPAQLDALITQANAILPAIVDKASPHDLVDLAEGVRLMSDQAQGDFPAVRALLDKAVRACGSEDASVRADAQRIVSALLDESPNRTSVPSAWRTMFRECVEAQSLSHAGFLTILALPTGIESMVRETTGPQIKERMATMTFEELQQLSDTLEDKHWDFHLPQVNAALMAQGTQAIGGYVQHGDLVALQAIINSTNAESPVHAQALAAAQLVLSRDPAALLSLKGPWTALESNAAIAHALTALLADPTQHAELANEDKAVVDWLCAVSEPQAVLISKVLEVMPLSEINRLRLQWTLKAQ